jgi:hypothetical protein
MRLARPGVNPRANRALRSPQALNLGCDAGSPLQLNPPPNSRATGPPPPSPALPAFAPLTVGYAVAHVAVREDRRWRRGVGDCQRGDPALVGDAVDGHLV